MTGTVVRVIVDKNFGFIRGEDGNEYFFHKSAIMHDVDFTQNLKDQKAEFNGLETEKGLRAEEVYLGDS